MAKKRSRSKSKELEKKTPANPAAERMRRGRQEQVDEIHGILRQLDPSLKRPKVK